MSTETQLKGDSLRRQLEQSQKYALENNLELVEFLQDLGVSAFRGKNASEGTLSKFLNYISKGLIESNSILIVESLDRLSRTKVGDALTQFLNIINSGIEIVTLTDNQRYTKESINNSPHSLYISLGVMFRANEESEIKSQRLKAAWSNKRKNAISNKEPLTTLCPAWLRLSRDRTRYEIIEDKAQVVKTIFDMCINNMGMYSITKHMNENKVPALRKGKYWHQSYISKILNSRSVFGEYQPHHYENGKRVKFGNPIKNYFPLIISEERFNLAHAQIHLRDNCRGRKGITFTNILSGLIYCQCGSKMSYRPKGSEPYNIRLVCNAKVAKRCDRNDWVYDETIELLFKHLKEINFNELTNSDDSLESNIRDSINLLENNNLKLKKQLDQSIEMSLNDDLSVDIKKRFIEKMNDLDTQIKANNESIEKYKLQLEQILASKQALSDELIKSILDQLKSTSDFMFRASVNTLLLKFIEKIELIQSEEMLPWELDNDSPEIIEYRKNHKHIKLDKILEKESFKRLFKKMNRSMIVKFRFGATRLIRGDNLSLYNNPLSSSLRPRLLTESKISS